MTKFFVGLLFSLVLPIGLAAQDDSLSSSELSDSWIDDTKTYYRVDIDEGGLYRIKYQTLVEAGFPLDRINGSQIELYSQGAPQRIRVTTTGRLGPEDYVEWFAKANDGTVDAFLYDDAPSQQLNPAVSLYGSPRPYYLTWTEGFFTTQYFEQRSNPNGPNIPLEERYYVHREEMVFDSFLYKPTHDGRNFIRYSSMDIGEGYGTKLAAERTIQIPIQNLSEIGVPPRLRMRFGTNALSRAWQIVVNDRIVTTVTTGGYNVVDIDVELMDGDITDGVTDVSIIPLANNNERHSLAMISIDYPRRYGWDTDDVIRYHQQPSILRRLISVPGYEGLDPIAYNLDAGYFLFPELRQDTLLMIIPSAQTTQEWVIIDRSTSVHLLEELVEVDMQLPVLSSATDYLILSSKGLIESGAVERYADYRSSSEGGGFTTDIVDVNALYDRFSFGVEGHPLAIRQYIEQLRRAERLPNYIMIIGKGREYSDINLIDVTNHVPTFGIPGSDNLLVAAPGERVPDVAVGRLAVTSANQVDDYLDKVREHENPGELKQDISSQAWKKRVIHLSGGSADIQEAIYRFLNNMGSMIESTTLGADVFTFRKRSADPLKAASTDDIVARIDEGASLLTFFGHSAVGTFDFSLEDPSKYENQGRNPIILSLGCHSGNIHTSSPGISEEFVLQPETGAVAFIASSGTAYAEPQYLTGLHLYDLLGGELYGQRIGQILQQALELRRDEKSLATQTLLEQLTLHGDPAFRYPVADGPDYVIDHQSIRVSPDIINTDQDNIELTLDLVNLGAVVNQEIDIQIVHRLPDGTPVDTLITTIMAPANRTSIAIELDNPGEIAAGENRLYITVDPVNLINESPDAEAEENNELMIGGERGYRFFVFDNSAKPVSPRDYGIVFSEDVMLRASLNNGLQARGEFVIQLDTTSTFDSPLLQSKSLVPQTTLIEWSPELDWQEGTVYYWRIAPEVANDQRKSRRWRTSSFIYLPNEDEGWNQSHFYQLLDNDYRNLELSEDDRRLRFQTRSWDIRIKNELRQDQDFWVFVNNTPWASLNPKTLAPGLAIFVWDPNQVIFTNSGTDYGSLPFSRDVFIYRMDRPADRRNIIDLLAAIPDGSRVFMHTILGDETSDLHVQDWLADSSRFGTTLYDELETYGATKVRSFLTRGTVPYTFVFDKGGEAVIEDMANNIEEIIDLSSRAETIWDRGYTSSHLVGPAVSWGSIEWLEEGEDSDISNVYVYGVDPEGNDTLLTVIDHAAPIDISWLDASEYPFLRLEYEAIDQEQRSAPHLDFWRVYYSPLPDLALNTSESDGLVEDTVYSGDDLVLQFDIANLTSQVMPATVIRYTLIGDDGTIREFDIDQELVLGNGHVSISHRVPTDRLEGRYQLVMEINPGLKVPELTDCNNFGYEEVFVRPDDIDPYLDVTFDGRYIRNLEVFDRNPVIDVTISDPNSFVLLDDPADFDVTLYFPQVFRWQIDTTSFAVEWIPATDLNDNRATLRIRPDLIQEGIYTLVVQAKDKSGNTAGPEPYQIQFEAVREKGEPNSLDIGPNPATSYVDFTYILEGERQPRVFDLYIYSPEGRLINKASSADFGGLQPGENTYRWEVRSASGDILPTGLYFYELVNSFDTVAAKKKGSILVIRE
ncbi:MAG: C25 family cysteine peptidase [Bacteroidota bacterium]